MYIPHQLFLLCIIWWCSPNYWLCFHTCWYIIVFLVWNDGCGFWVLTFCRYWGFPFAGKFHPRICGSLGWIDMFDLHLCLFCLIVGFFSIFFRMSFQTLGNEDQYCVVVFGMLFLTLRNKNRSSRSYIVCLKISTNFLIACNFLTPMDTNGAVGAGF